MKRYWKIFIGLTVFSALATGMVHAEDIDIYGNHEAGTSNVLVILDNAAAASGNSSFICSALAVNDPNKNFGFEQCGLYSSILDLSQDPAIQESMKVGLMYFPTGPTNGGTFVLPGASPAPSSLVKLDPSGSDQMLSVIKNLSLAKDKSNNNQIAQALQEGWAFFQGRRGLSGTGYPGLASDEICGRNYIIYITLATNNQKPQDSGDLGKNALSSAYGALPSTIKLPSYYNAETNKTASAKYQSDYSDEWARFMLNSSTADGKTTFRPVRTYTITLYDGSNPDYEQLMKSMASNGGGEFLLVKLGDTQGLIDALKKVFYQIQAVNSVFAAPVLPVSANSQGTYSNQVFMGMFRPDPNRKPRWMGNLKQYQIGVDTSDPTSPQLFLGDASWGPYQPGLNANRALSASGTGFLAPDAISFWTSKNTGQSPDKENGFWLNAIKLQNARDGFDSPDGQVVERGGVSQQLRLAYLKASAANNYRNIYTCNGDSCTNGTSLNTMPFTGTDEATKSGFSTLFDTVSTAFQRFIGWIRGRDTHAQDTDSAAGPEVSAPPVTAITVRGSIHGDVLHSRPAVIDYGGTTGVVVFYGSNDGLFRAINGNQPNNTSDTAKPKGFCTISANCVIATKNSSGADIDVMPGGELWSFIPPEFFPKLERLYKNTPNLEIGVTAEDGVLPKEYFFDGSPSVYFDAASGKAYLFLSARRGGRLLYALDVSDPTNPKFMWKRDNTSDGFAEMGQTWSQPKVARVMGYANPVLIFGAGYDPNEDKEPPIASTMGRGIFILDAVNGDLLWNAQPGGYNNSCQGNPCRLADMTHAIAADTTLVDRNFDGFIDRLYAVDMGGNIWRVDLLNDGSNGTSKWQVNLLAALGGTGTDSTRRKFFFPPDVAPGPGYDAVVAITGDREHPLLSNQANGIVNRFYMIKDPKIGLNANGLVPVVDDSDVRGTNAPEALFDATDTEYDGSKNGFFVILKHSGEKGVNAPTVISGTAYFSTNQPLSLGPEDAAVCSNLGAARNYSVNYMTGQLNTTLLDGGGLPPSPVSGMVTVYIDGQKRDLPFIIGGGEGAGNVTGTSRSPLETTKVLIDPKLPRKRAYWYREVDQ